MTLRTRLQRLEAAVRPTAAKEDCLTRFPEDNLLTVMFEAHNASKNHHRRYQVTVGRDLLSAWTVSISYGRIGQGGRQLHYASPEPETIRAVIHERLRRRLSAPKRIGCPYRLTAFSAAPGVDATAWLPGEIMARFFEGA